MVRILKRVAPLLVILIWLTACRRASETSLQSQPANLLPAMVNVNGSVYSGLWNPVEYSQICSYLTEINYVGTVETIVLNEIPRKHLEADFSRLMGCSIYQVDDEKVICCVEENDGGFVYLYLYLFK